MKVVYKRTAGIATDIRYVAEDYELGAGESFYVFPPGDSGDLPTVQQCSDQAAWQAKVDAEAALAAKNASLDTAMGAATYGTIQPATLAQLRAMNNAAYGAWFDANFTNAAQALGLLKLLTRIILRRVL